MNDTYKKAILSYLGHLAGNGFGYWGMLEDFLKRIQQTDMNILKETLSQMIEKDLIFMFEDYPNVTLSLTNNGFVLFFATEEE